MNGPRLWIDLDNAPHVLFFAPLIRDLEQHGIDVRVTVRSFGQTEELARAHGLKFVVIGEHRTPRHFTTRAAATIWRATQLAHHVAGFKPDAAVGHGTRSLTIAACLLRVPSMTLYDYEFVAAGMLNRLSTVVMVPDCIPLQRLRPRDPTTFIRYPGFKEDVYVRDLRPDEAVLTQLGLNPQRLIVIVRPPATWAHYHHHQSVLLFAALVERLRREATAQVLVLPRTLAQGEQLMRDYGMDKAPFRVLTNAVDGLSLMWYSDAVFSGGGTMVREAALLGVPVYSIFGGRLGSADAALEAQGKLLMLHDTNTVLALPITKRRPAPVTPSYRSPTRDFIFRQILTFTCGHRAELRPAISN